MNGINFKELYSEATVPLFLSHPYGTPCTTFFFHYSEHIHESVLLYPALYFFFLLFILYLRLFVFAVPPKKPIIHDANGRKMTSTLGPYKVGEKLIATCVTSAGNYVFSILKI